MKWKYPLICVCAAFMTACTAEKTEDGEMPDVDVTVSDSVKLPEYDVNTPTVEVGADTSTVVTPDVDVKPAKSNE